MRDDRLIEQLAEETAQSQRAAGNAEDLLGVVFTFLKRSHAANLNADEIGELLGIAPGCVLDRAALSEIQEDAVLELYAAVEGCQKG